MENKETTQNLSAQSFFEENKFDSTPNTVNTEFKESLREQVLQEYLTFEEKQKMDTQTKVSFFKRHAILLSASLFTVVTIIAAVIIFIIPGTNKNTIIRGEIAYTEGNVFYKNLTTEWVKAEKNIVLDQGSSLMVSGIGRAILNLDDGSSIRLDSDTTISLTSMDPEHLIITNQKGEVYSRVMKADRLFDVVANGVIYRSLGTAYKTSCLDYIADNSPIDLDKENIVTVNAVEVYESKVKILGINDNDEIIVEQGNKYYVVNMNEPDLTAKVIEVNMAEIKSDEFLMWNKEQDEKIQAFKSQMGILFDIKAPTLNLASPMDGEETQSETILVSGSTDSDTKITVNTIEVVNNNGSFSYELTLVPGVNGIKVIAEDPSGNKSVRNLTVKYSSLITPSTTISPSKAPTSIPTPKITLNGTKVSNGVSFTWNVVGLDVSNGFKLVKSLSANPVYPGNDYQYLTNQNQRNYTWEIKDGKTYHFRICQYNGSGTCLVYSNDITVQAPSSGPSNPVTGIGLNISGTTANWTVTGGIASNGFKIIWSKSSGPTYSPRAGDNAVYASGTTSGSYSGLSAFDGYGTYYVRVCAYQNGAGGECSPYSNEKTITFTAPTATPTLTPTIEPTPI